MNWKNNKICNDESGYILVLAIMVLAILMIAGVMSSNTAVTDLGVARNTIIHHQNIAAAESAAMVAAQALENETDENILNYNGSETDWINADLSDETASAEDKAEHWQYIVDSAAFKTPENTTRTFEMIDGRDENIADKPKYRVIGWKHAAGTSIGEYAPSLKTCRIIGAYESASYGLSRVELGYKKRF